MEVNRGLFIDCLDLMEVNKIKKHILGFTQLNIILTLALISGETRTALSILYFVYPYSSLL